MWCRLRRVCPTIGKAHSVIANGMKQSKQSVPAGENLRAFFVGVFLDIYEFFCDNI